MDRVHQLGFVMFWPAVEKLLNMEMKWNIMGEFICAFLILLESPSQ
jgi:hypothetical protein